MIVSIPFSVLSLLESKLNCKIKAFKPASGGCINQGGEFVTDAGSYFLKWNDATRYPKMFKTEAAGLNLLRSKKCIHIPEVILTDESDGIQFILMEFIRQAYRTKNYWSELGEQLAKLHKSSESYFGLPHDNYIGSLSQSNTKRYSWSDFFIHHRLEPQLELARKSGKADHTLCNQFDRLYEKLPDMMPDENPSLLHGDLWSGNIMVNDAGSPALIDPAVYYGAREAELAFTTLFGGIDQEFYDAYQGVFPLQMGFEQRIDLYNLYPLLVHANLFGGGYVSHLSRVLKRYV